jgi:large subunit ribosomal protein L30
MAEDSDSMTQEKVKRPRAPRKPKAESAAKPRKPADGKKAGAPKKAESAEKKEVQGKPQEKEVPKHEKLFAVVRVRGTVGVTREMADTMLMLRLDRINHCVILPKNPNFEGMLRKAKDFITWGEIDRETLEKLISKRGRFAGDRRVADLNYAKELAQFILSGKPVKETGIKPVFRLSPPSKGYKSTKAIYPKGSLGYRGEKINELIKRMI